MAQEAQISIQKKIFIKPNKGQATPILLRKENRLQLCHGETSNLFIKNIKFGPSSTLYQEDVVFESDSFIRDSPVRVTIMNRLDLLKNTTRTVVTYYDKLKGNVLSEKTSDQISRFIGQHNYETILTAICSVPEEEVKVKGIIALLTKESVEDHSTQTEEEDMDNKDFIIVQVNDGPPKKMEEKCCQTDENCMDLIFKLKQKKRNKRSMLTPYVVKDPPQKIVKKVVVNPDNRQNVNILNKFAKKHDKQSTVNHLQTVKLPERALPAENESEPTAPLQIVRLPTEVNMQDLPVIQLNEDSNDNVSLTGLSVCSETVLHNAKDMLQSIANHTTKEEGTIVTAMNSLKHYIRLPNGTNIEVPVKPEFPFHMATPDILKGLNPDDKVKVLTYQAYLDYKLCLDVDSDGYLPLHNAVLSNDVDLLRRQCVVLRYRQQSLDIPAGNMTALQMSIYKEAAQCTALLLQHGADPLLTDEEHRTCLHLASENSSDSLKAVLNHCESNSRSILQEHEELWKPKYETKSKDELDRILLDYMCSMVDNQGYTALMLTAKAGNYMGAKMLLEASPESINQPMPNSGNTAVFLAVEGACHDASNRGNKSKVADRYYQTISILLDNGPDLSIANHAGTTINDLLTENSNAELSGLFSSKATMSFDGLVPRGTQFESYMLLKNSDGEVSLTELKKPKNDDAKKTFVSKNDIEKQDSKMTTIVLNNLAGGMNKIIKNESDVNDFGIEKKLAPQINKIIKSKQNFKMAIGTKKMAADKNKNEKPIILENTKVIIDPKSLKTTQHVKIISPKEKLVNIRQIVNTKTADSTVVSPISTQSKSIPSTSFIVKKVDNLNNTDLSNVDKNETLKRKSGNGSGSSGKKPKLKSLKT